MSELRFVVVTGMSGAGRSTALRALEDLGYFCVDNLPPPLIPGLVSLLEAEHLERIGLGIDVRTGSFLEGAEGYLQQLTDSGHNVQLIFLEAQDSDLVRRFSETRRAHPLAPDGDVPTAISNERERLAPLRSSADLIIDTSAFTVHDLRRQLIDRLSRQGAAGQMVTRIVSFGFKFGLPVDADLVFDLRYLPNPHFVPELRPLTGRDARVSDFVLKSEAGQELLSELSGMLKKLLPRYQREGKSYLTIGIGCTGGQHRSVAMAIALHKALSSDANVVLEHRDAPIPELS